MTGVHISQRREWSGGDWKCMRCRLTATHSRAGRAVSRGGHLRGNRQHSGGRPGEGAADGVAGPGAACGGHLVPGHPGANPGFNAIHSSERFPPAHMCSTMTVLLASVKLL